MGEKDKGAAVGGGLLGAAAGTGLGYALGRASKAEAAPEEKEVIVVYELDEATRASIAQSVATALEPTLKELAMAERPQKQAVFKHTLDPLQGIIEHKHVSMIKTVRSITIHWPDGCNALVDVAVGYSQDKRLLPEDGYLALNDATPTWPVNKAIEGDTLWVQIKNGDSVNEHIISVIINYDEEVV